MKKNRFRKIDKLLEIPTEVYTNQPKITIIGFEELILKTSKEFSNMRNIMSESKHTLELLI